MAPNMRILTYFIFARFEREGTTMLPAAARRRFPGLRFVRDRHMSTLGGGSILTPFCGQWGHGSPKSEAVGVTGCGIAMMTAVPAVPPVTECKKVNGQKVCIFRTKIDSN